MAGASGGIDPRRAGRWGWTRRAATPPALSRRLAASDRTALWHHGPIVIVLQISLLLLEAWLPAIRVCMSIVALALGST